MSSFEDADEQARFVVPASVTSKQLVKLPAKKLATKKEVRTVLPEEDYLDGLEKIIQRDYFPELPKLKAQREYMDAMERGDLAAIRSLQLRFGTGKRTERRTPAPPTEKLAQRPTSPRQFDPDTPGPSTGASFRAPTPLNPDLPNSNIEGDNEEHKKKKKTDLDKMSVDAYLQKFTSEDNASFEELTELAALRERARHAWMYEAEEKHNAELVTQGKLLKDADLQLAIKDVPEAITGIEKPKALDNWEFKARNTVLFNPDGHALTIAEKVEAQKRSQRVINREATRFPDDLRSGPAQSSMARAAFAQATAQAGKVDVTGQEVQLKASTLGLVATPHIDPGVEDSPLMTWGEIEGTPFRLDGGDIVAPPGGPTFKIPDVPHREEIAQTLSDTIAKRYREKRVTSMKQAENFHGHTPTFGSARSTLSTERLLQMSPAARKLATNKLGIRLGSSNSLKARLTPSPMSRTPGSSHGLRLGTPTSRLAASSKTRTPVSSSSASITDNLLLIDTPHTPQKQTPSSPSKKKPRAADFFD